MKDHGRPRDDPADVPVVLCLLRVVDARILAAKFDAAGLDAI
jgi:hypothetical protein